MQPPLPVSTRVLSCRLAVRWLNGVVATPQTPVEVVS